jgi:hypothetical protein
LLIWRRIKLRRKKIFILNVGCLVQFFGKNISMEREQNFLEVKFSSPPNVGDLEGREYLCKF